MQNEFYHYGVRGMKWGHRKKINNSFDNPKKQKRKHKKEISNMDKYWDKTQKNLKIKNLAKTMLFLSGQISSSAKSDYDKYKNDETKVRDISKYKNIQTKEKVGKALAKLGGITSNIYWNKQYNDYKNYYN